MKKILVLLALMSATVSADPLVYTRQPRLSQAIDVPGYAPLGEAANWSHWYEAGQPNRYTEAEVVIDDLKGNITRIGPDCLNTPEICAVHDARVSPDGKLIAYTVAYGNTFTRPKAWADGPFLPAIEFTGLRYEIGLYDTVTKQNFQVETNARQPDWADNDTIVFTSDRAGDYSPWSSAGNYYPMKSLHVYRGTLGQNKLTNVTPILPSKFCMNPAVMSDSRAYMSCWEGFGDRDYGHTGPNMWWVWSCNQNGTDCRAVLGAHGSPVFDVVAKYLTGIVDPLRKGVGGTSFRVLGPVSELKKGTLAVTNYYRGNHQGRMGQVISFPIPGPAEGFSQAKAINESYERGTNPGSGRYVPQVMLRTPFGTDSDDMWRYDINGKVMGKAGYAAPAYDMGEFLFTWCNGACYEATMPAMANREAMGGGPTSHRSIALALTPRVTNPRDPKQVRILACADETYNCWDARLVTPHEAPPQAPAMLTGKLTTLQIVDATKGELWPLTGPNVHPWDKVGLQGNADADFATTIAAIRIDAITPWKVVPKVKGFAATKTVGTYPLQEDGSVKAVFECGINYKLLGVNKAGGIVATDNTIHTAVCGEVVQCHGCHDAHSQERVDALKDSAEYRFMHGGKDGGPVMANAVPGC
jgi:hypothetical protein